MVENNAIMTKSEYESKIYDKENKSKVLSILRIPAILGEIIVVIEIIAIIVAKPENVSIPTYIALEFRNTSIFVKLLYLALVMCFFIYLEKHITKKIDVNSKYKIYLLEVQSKQIQVAMNARQTDVSVPKFCNECGKKLSSQMLQEHQCFNCGKKI